MHISTKYKREAKNVYQKHRHYIEIKKALRNSFLKTYIPTFTIKHKQEHITVIRKLFYNGILRKDRPLGNISEKEDPIAFSKFQNYPFQN